MTNLLILLFNIADITLNILFFCIFLSVLFTWFPQSQSHPFVQMINGIARPIINPIKKILPTVGMFDFSPLVALFGIQILMYFVEALKVMVLT